MKLVVPVITPTIDLNQLLEAYQNGAIIGAVYENKLSIWVERENYGQFAHFDRGVSYAPHSRRDFDLAPPMTALINAVKLNLNVGSLTKIYVFDDLRDLAESVLDNGWE